MKKNQKEFDLEAFNEIMNNMPSNVFKERIVFTERARKCAQCKYLAIDMRCAKCDCNFYSKIFNSEKRCPLKKW